MKPKVSIMRKNVITTSGTLNRALALSRISRSALRDEG